MSKPLRERLPGSEASDAAVERVWQRVNERGERRVWPYAAALAASAAVVAFFALRAGPCDGPLCTQSGLPMQAALSGDAVDHERTVELADRSRVTLGPRTVARVATNAATAVDIELSTGTLAVHVEPKGPRRWGITAGDVRVEVVGTTFSVARAEGGVRVEVSEGTVQVSGPSVPGGVTRVTAGGSFTNVPAADSPTPSLPPKPETPRPSPPATSPSSPVRSSTTKPKLESPEQTAVAGELPDWRTPARQGRFADAASLLGDRLEAAAASATAADVILLADVAASSGDAVASERLLAKVAAMQASAEEHALAEYKRGQRLLARGEAKLAAEALEQAIAFGLPPAMKDSGRALVIEAWRRAGDAAKADEWRTRP